MALQTDDALTRATRTGVVGPLQQGPRTVRPVNLAWWTRRRVVAALVLVAVMGWAYWSASAGTASPWLVGALAIGGGVSLATFVPARGQAFSEALGGSCGVMAGVYPLLAAMAITMPGQQWLAVVIIGWGLLQRLTRTGCSI
ncbi:hypothetical protein [Aestuariimicrobium ganziense]|uniref:hypothetical protein n=1 Tax=Aestuariimicrobium ganziense TaxID=2773677 RepID=UPI00194170A9|nr:hypothetical protein [Aestuariimicrobium ganziense]